MHNTDETHHPSQCRLILSNTDYQAVHHLIKSTDEFNQEEQSIALELLEESFIKKNQDYHIIITENLIKSQEKPIITGYVCYGKTPMTTHTFDLYWMAVHPLFRQQRIGQKLVEACEQAIKIQMGKIIRIETSTRKGYEKTGLFYERCGYSLNGRIHNFYTTGDDLLTYVKYLVTG